MSEFLRFDNSKERGSKDPMTKVLLGFFAALFTVELNFMKPGKGSPFSRLFK